MIRFDKPLMYRPSKVVCQRLRVQPQQWVQYVLSQATASFHDYQISNVSDQKNQDCMQMIAQPWDTIVQAVQHEQTPHAVLEVVVIDHKVFIPSQFEKCYEDLSSEWIVNQHNDTKYPTG